MTSFPDLMNMTFEETDGGLDRSHDTLGTAFKTRQDGEPHTVDDCAMYRDDWNGLQRHEQRILVWIVGVQDEDPWEYNIALRQGLVPHSVRGVHASLQELSYLRMILKNDGVTITAVERTVQGKGTVDNQNFQTQLILCTSLVDDHATNGAVFDSAVAGPTSGLSQKQTCHAIKWQNTV